jgi:hypothetical protein
MSKLLMKVVSITPNLAADSVAATTAYADKDVIGDHLTVAAAGGDVGGHLKLRSVVVKNKTTTDFVGDIYLLNEAPASAYGANNSAFALADTDLSKVVGLVSIAAGDNNAAGSDNKTAVKMVDGPVMKCKAGSADLVAIVVARGAITFGAAGDLIIDLGFEQDSA